MPEITINALTNGIEICEQLAEMLTEAVAGGGSVSFLHPLAPEAAEAFWQASMSASASCWPENSPTML